MTWRSIDDHPPLSGTLILLRHPEASRPEDVRMVGPGGIHTQHVTEDGTPVVAVNHYWDWSWRPLMPTMTELNDWWQDELPKLTGGADVPRCTFFTGALFAMMERAGVDLSRVKLSVTGKTFDVWRSQAARTAFEREWGTCVASWNAGADRSDSRYRRAIALPELTP